MSVKPQQQKVLTTRVSNDSLRAAEPVRSTPVDSTLPTREQIEQTLPTLEPRYRQVFSCLLQGKDVKAVEEELGMKPATAAWYCSGVFRLLNFPQTNIKKRTALLQKIYARASSEPEQASSPERMPVPDKAAAPSEELCSEPAAMSPTHGYGISQAVQIDDPDSVESLEFLRSDSEHFTEKFQKLRKQGYRPEIVNQFQSLSDPKVSVSHVLLIKRTP